jgi:succinate-semialdehyde dehydrogenase/glutarate-semialdehyde dehydrogenase
MAVDTSPRTKLVSTNPSRGYEVVGEVEVSTPEDVVAAISRARQAQPAWAGMALTDRCRLFRSFADAARRHGDDMARLLVIDAGRDIKNTRGLIEATFTYFDAQLANAAAYLSPRTTYETDTEIHRVFREPYGVMACISPWNYPFLNIAYQCSQGLIAGNTVVYKHSENAPLFGKLLKQMIDESQLPSGVFEVVHGGPDVGDLLARGDIDLLAFTGSTKTGLALAAIAAEKFIPIIAELGGSSPMVVFEDAQTDNLAEFIWGRRFENAGQYCDAVKRLIVHESLFDQVVQDLTDVVATKKVGDALDEGTDMGPLVSEKQLDKLESQVKDAVDKGATVRIGGHRPPGLEGAYYSPTILTDVTTSMRVWTEEVFGPVLPVVAFHTEDEAIAMANDTDYGLGAHVITSDHSRFQRVARAVKSGMVGENTALFWNPESPFGGYKRSGMGRTHGGYGFDEVTQPKVISEQVTGVRRN